MRQHASACVSMRQHASACVSMRQHASACVSMRQHASACVSMRQHASAAVYQAVAQLAGVTAAFLKKKKLERTVCTHMLTYANVC